jgi:Family of unknown function (DUF5946)
MLLINPVTERGIFTCPSCGANVFGGIDGCNKLFEDILTLEYGDPSYGAVHLLSVDAFVLQHSEYHGPRSNAFHLIRLCWLLEGNGDPRIGRGGSRLKAVLKSYRRFPFLPPPENQGEITVADVVEAAGPGEHAERVRQWARSVWQAWKVHHEWARQWLERL